MELQKYFEKGINNRIYIEKTFNGTEEEYKETLKNSSTVYVGGLLPEIKEERIWHLFSIAGPVKRVIMGVNKTSLTPCGFCFVEYDEVSSSDNAVVFFKEFYLDGSMIKVDKDLGFVEGRQYGRKPFVTSSNFEGKRRRF